MCQEEILGAIRKVKTINFIGFFSLINVRQKWSDSARQHCCLYILSYTKRSQVAYEKESLEPFI